MLEQFDFREIDPKDPDWTRSIDGLRVQLGAPDNELLFPPHFLKATFPEISGRLLVCTTGQQVIGVGFLFPRCMRGESLGYTLRYHATSTEPLLTASQFAQESQKRLYPHTVVSYDPAGSITFERTSHERCGIDIGQPDRREAESVRRLQQEIWHSESEYLYPTDIHAVEFQAGTTLIARINNEPAGFLFGFYKFTNDPLPEAWQRTFHSDFRIESQLMGVRSAQRGQNIGLLLKKRQAELARCQDIDIINWTVDPLQFGNAVLNFGSLNAISFGFYSNYYPFRNALNQVSASRLVVTWLINSRPARRAISSHNQFTIPELADIDDVEVINQGWQTLNLKETASRIAIELPFNWTRLQRESPEQALRWREATDDIFEHYLGHEPDQYMITGVGKAGRNRYLVAERVTPAVLDRFESVP